MKSLNNTINLCILPILCFLPMFGILSCSADEAATISTQAIDTVSQRIAEFPENAVTAAPYIQQDLEKLWYSVTGNIEIVGEQVGISEPPHPLAEAETAREKIISGASFEEVADNAMHELTIDDLNDVPASDLAVLNGVLPFDIDLASCGDTLAEVLNKLDIGQVSAVLRSEAGYHLIQLLDREGAKLKIGHIVFEINPSDPVVAEEPSDVSDYDIVAQGPGSDENSDPLQEALNRLARAIENR